MSFARCSCVCADRRLTIRALQIITEPCADDANASKGDGTSQVNRKQRAVKINQGKDVARHEQLEGHGVSRSRETRPHPPTMPAARTGGTRNR